MNRIMPFFRQITGLRIVAFAALAFICVQFNDVLGIDNKASYVAHAINLAASVLIYDEYAWLRGSYEVEYGWTCLYLYAAIVMIGVAVALYRRHATLSTKRRALIITPYAMIAVTTMIVVGIKVASATFDNTGGWYERFYMYTLLPPFAVTILVSVTCLLWVVTKPPSEEPAPANQVQFPRTWWSILLRTKGFKKAVDQSEGPKALAAAS